MNLVEVNAAAVDSPPWAARCAGFARKVLRLRGIHDWELSILLCDDLTIRELNRRYRGVDAPTDVLAFSQARGEDWPVDPDRGGPGAAGDIVISLESMRRNAEGRALGADEELKRLVIHGILHLEGLEHPAGATQMLEAQEGILEALRRERVL